LIVLAIKHLQHANPPLVENIDSTIQIFGSEIFAGGVQVVARKKWEQRGANDVGFQ
jgi:hypothetical protein